MLLSFEKIYGAGAIEALDIPDKQAYIEGMVEEWRAEKENGLEERLWEEAYDNYDPYYYTRSITKEELGAESNRRDMAILEINLLANIST
jgi:hypothetical protein